ncbi:MAG TPA: hypothetical protein VL971_01935 [Rhizomicrobium sp.]|jgi:hypothetical protein|nr:hypothetical protein [Rhizomicrobium sp.]
MTFDFYTLAGFAGSIVVLAAYFANQTGRLASDDWRFPFINLAGSLMILSSFYTAINWPSLFIEIFWIGISVYGLGRTLRLSRKV